MRVKCLAQEHNTMSPAGARTWAARSGVERTNHEATTPPNYFLFIYSFIIFYSLRDIGSIPCIFQKIVWTNLWPILAPFFPSVFIIIQSKSKASFCIFCTNMSEMNHNAVVDQS